MNAVDHTPARMLAQDLGYADKEAPIVIELGRLGRRRVTGYVIQHGGSVHLRVETWKQMRSRMKAARCKVAA